MKKSYNVRINSMFFYTFLMFLSNYIAFQVVIMIISNLLQPIADKFPYALLVICVSAVYILINFAVPSIFYFFFFRSVVEEHYIPSEDKFHWAKSCAKLILPAEIIRFLICQVTLGHITTSGTFASLPCFSFENTYLHWTNRREQVRQLLQYNFVDFVAYAVCYMIYIAVYLVLVMLIYRHFWLKSKKDREDLIAHESLVNNHVT